MKRILTSTAGQLALVVGFAVFGGISFWYWGAPSGDHVQRVVEAHRAREFEEKVEPELSPASQHAMAYIDAAISCDCEGIVSRTEWMQARLLALSESGASPEALAADRKKLCDNFCERKEAGFRVLDEGVDDPYLFFPGVEYRFVGEDSGREDLEVPVRGCRYGFHHRQGVLKILTVARLAESPSG